MSSSRVLAEAAPAARWSIAPDRTAVIATEPLTLPSLRMGLLLPIARPSLGRGDRGARLALACLALVPLLAAANARAHTRSISYSSFLVGADGADVSLRMPLLELSRLGPAALPPDVLGDATSAPLDADGVPDSLAGSSAGEAAEYFAEALVLVSNATVCPPSTHVRRAPDAAGWIRYRWRVECPTATGALEIRSRVLLDVAPSHLHFARVRFEATPERIREQVLTEAAPRFVLRGDPASDPSSGSGNSAASEIGSRFVDYLALGVRHILSGWDHLAFLFGLILLSDRLRTIARLVTGFTLAHSLTLALGVLDLVHPHAAAVEAVIAFSVALVAIEKGWLVAGRPRVIPACLLAGLALLALASALSTASLPTVSVLGLILFTVCYFAIAERTQSDRFRIALTFAFGLVHGFGFAGILQGLELPTDRLVPALAGFNLGVEIGQIGIVLLAWPALALAGRVTAPRWRHGVRDLATAGLCGVGCFWLLERAFSS